MPTVFPFRILQEHAEKPKFGEPCNNCGLCCRVALCEPGKHLFPGQGGPCPALEMHDGKFLCGMILRPQHYFPTMAPENIDAAKAWMRSGLGIGYGCSMDDVVLAVGEYYDDEE